MPNPPRRSGIPAFPKRGGKPGVEHDPGILGLAMAWLGSPHGWAFLPCRTSRARGRAPLQNLCRELEDCLYGSSGDAVVLHRVTDRRGNPCCHGREAATAPDALRCMAVLSTGGSRLGYSLPVGAGEVVPSGLPQVGGFLKYQSWSMGRTGFPVAPTLPTKRTLRSSASLFQRAMGK